MKCHLGAAQKVATSPILRPAVVPESQLGERMIDHDSEPAPTKQREAFLGGEGDAYDQRNAEAPANLAMLQLLVPYLRPGARLLEIGCGAGRNLVALERLVPGISCFGIDPSAQAIARGCERSPHHRLEVGTADSLPFEGPFDVVFFGFCLYLCDRSLLHSAVAQADAVLNGGEGGQRGFLAILDFDPDQPHRRAYRHDDRIASFKADYSALFLADPAYRLVAKFAFDHARDDLGWALDPNDRVALWILEKNAVDAYPQRL